jgi:hypothetical protein
MDTFIHLHTINTPNGMLDMRVKTVLDVVLR